MRIVIPAKRQGLQGPEAGSAASFCLRTFAVAAVAACALFAVAQQPGTQADAAPTKSNAAHKPAHPHRRPSAVLPPAATPQAVPVSPPAPAPPDWPANDKPAEGSVVWNSQGLRIEASNSSLSQILKDVETATGVRVQGLGSDLRIFGSYGPGPARDVLAQLLDGSGYNMLMIGDQGQGTPREIVLSAQPSGAASPAVNSPTASNDENNDADEQPLQPQQPPALRNGFAPGAPPRTPQQIMQEMQQRQQQQNQQQQNQPNNPQ